jgi:hypothetical protein
MNLSRTLIAGMALAALAIALFLALWYTLGFAGLDQTPRLFAALCLPPAIVFGIVALFVLARGKQSGGES